MLRDEVGLDYDRTCPIAPYGSFMNGVEIFVDKNGRVLIEKDNKRMLFKVENKQELITLIKIANQSEDS